EEETFNPRRIMVVSSNSVGKEENSRTDFVKRVNVKIVIDNAIFMTRRKSSRKAGSGIIIMQMIATTKKAVALLKYSALFSCFPLIRFFIYFIPLSLIQCL